MISNYLIKDAVKNCTSLYTVNTGDFSSNNVWKTNEPIMKLVDDITTKATEGNADLMMRNSTKIAQLYFTHKLITVKQKKYYCFIILDANEYFPCF